MSGREWKPGDVAMAEGSRVMRTGNGWLYASTLRGRDRMTRHAIRYIPGTDLAARWGERA